MVKTDPHQASSYVCVHLYRIGVQDSRLEERYVSPETPTFRAVNTSKSPVLRREMALLSCENTKLVLNLLGILDKISRNTHIHF